MELLEKRSGPDAELKKARDDGYLPSGELQRELSLRKKRSDRWAVVLFLTFFPVVVASTWLYSHGSGTIAAIAAALIPAIILLAFGWVLLRNFRRPVCPNCRERMRKQYIHTASGDELYFFCDGCRQYTYSGVEITG